MAIFFVAIMLCASSQKTLWIDEVFTLHIAQLPSAYDIITKMTTSGGDTSPPLLHLMVHAALYLPLSPETAFRIPPLVGFTVMLCSVYLFTRRYTTVPLACFATALTLAHFRYAIDARHYGIWLGAASLAMLLWRKAAEENARPIYAIGFAICLSIATNIHFYGMLSIMPFIVAELMRYKRERQIRIPILIALACACLSTIALVPYALYAYKFSAKFWAPPNIWSSYNAYIFLFGQPMFYCMAAWGYYKFTFKKRFQAPTTEIIMLVTACFMPLAVHLLSLFTNAYAPRYALGALPAGAVLMAWLAHDIRQKKIVCGLLVACMMYSAATQALAMWNIIKHEATRLNKYTQYVQSLSDKNPQAIIVTNNSHIYMEIRHYGNIPLERFFFLGGGTVSELALQDISPIFPTNIMSYQTFQERSQGKAVDIPNVPLFKTWDEPTSVNEP